MRGGVIDFWEKEEEEEEEVKSIHKPCNGFTMCKCCMCLMCQYNCQYIHTMIKYNSPVVSEYSALKLLKELKYGRTHGLSIRYTEDGWRLAGKHRKIIKYKYRFAILPMDLIKIICSFI